MKVGVWPARSDNGNPFLDVFAHALRGAGADVLHVETPADVAPGMVDVLHVHWPEQVFWTGARARRMPLLLLRTARALRRLRAAGVVIVWMVHNLQPHDMSRRRRALWQIYQAQICAVCDGFMTLSPGTVGPVRRGIPGLAGKPARAVWFPAYPPVPPDPTPEQVREGLGVPARGRLYGFLGLLRPYKGIEVLMAAFAELPDMDARLVIAGPCSDAAYARALGDLAATDGRVTLRAGHLSAAAFAAHQAAVDVTVLPFRDYLHSSSIVQAVGEHRPVLTPDTPFARAIGGVVGPGWVQTYERPLRGAHLAACKRPDTAPDLTTLSPEALGRETVAFYGALMDARPASETGRFSRRLLARLRTAAPWADS